MQGTCKSVIIVVITICSSIIIGCQTKAEKQRDVQEAKTAGVVAPPDNENKSIEQPETLISALHRMALAYGKANDNDVIASDSLVRIMIDSAALYLSSRLFMVNDPERIVGAMNELVFDKWGISFNADRNNVNYLFPHTVLDKKQGSCVGISLLYLLIAEKLGTPLYGVLAPGHFYVRFDDGITVRNIETLRKGEDMSESWYREKYSIDDTLLYAMEKLTTGEVVAVVNYNLGTISLSEKRSTEALAYLKKCVDTFPSFVEAQGNYALVLDAAGESGKALKILTDIKHEYPDFINIDRNIAALQIKCNDYAAALVTYGALTRKNPHHPEYLYGKGLALYRLKRFEEARNALNEALLYAAEGSSIKKTIESISKRVPE